MLVAHKPTDWEVDTNNVAASARLTLWLQSISPDAELATPIVMDGSRPAAGVKDTLREDAATVIQTVARGYIARPAPFAQWVATVDGETAVPAIAGDTAANTPDAASAADGDALSEEAVALQQAIQLAVAEAIIRERAQHDEVVRAMQAKQDELMAARVVDRAAPPTTPRHLMPANVPNTALKQLRFENTPAPAPAAPLTPADKQDEAVTNARSYILNAMIAYENALASLRKQRSAAATAARRIRSMITFILSLAGRFSPSQLGFAALLAYVVMPQVSPPLVATLRALVVRMWKKLNNKGKAMLVLAVQAFLRAAKIELKTVQTTVVEPVAV